MEPSTVCFDMNRGRGSSNEVGTLGGDDVELFLDIALILLALTVYVDYKNSLTLMNRTSALASSPAPDSVIAAIPCC